MAAPIDTPNAMTPPAALLGQLPIGITVVDLEGRILYYNDTCAQLVDRKPEYIGRDIRSCHKKSESVEAIDRMLDDIHSGRKKSVYYEAERQGRTLAVTISTYEVNGKLAGTIQSISVKHT